MLLSNLQRLMTHPDQFYREGVDDSPLWHPAVLVLCAGAINVSRSLMTAQHLSVSVEGLGRTALGVAQLVGVLVGLASVFAIWVVFSAAMHGLSGILGSASGEFRKTFQYVGWGFLPSILGGLFDTYATWSALKHVPASVSPEQLQAATQSLPVMNVATGIGFVVMAWQAFIWLFAIRHARALSLRRSAVVVSLPILARLGPGLYGLL
jgi:hypothetical protein